MFMEDPDTRVLIELMQERPAVFEHVTIEDLATLWQGGTLRGTWHDRKALLLWAQHVADGDAEEFHKGGTMSGTTKRDKRAAAILKPRQYTRGGSW